MKKGIEQEIESITKQIIEKYRLEKTILFGSAAFGLPWHPIRSVVQYQ